MSCPPHSLLLAMFLMTSHVAFSQNFLPLDFSHNVQATNAIYPNQSTLGPHYFNGTTLDFADVTTSNGQSIDARVTILGSAGSYEYVGFIPDYNTSNSQPGDDLGVYYRHINGDFSAPTGGIAYTITFYEGDGSFSNLATLSDFRIMVYDVDGEPGQSESIRTYAADGFTGYQIHESSGIHTHDEGDSYRFDAAGQGLSETGPEGSFIAYYQNTSSIRFDMFSTTLPSNPSGANGIFAGFDGNLSITGGQPVGYGGYIAVPEPSTSSLAVAALSMALMRRHRSKR